MKTAITFLACLCLIAITIVEFPSGSHAFQTPAQEPSASRPAAFPKRSKQRYVPGEVLVRYRSESIARTRTGRTLLTAPDGQDVAAEVERRMASDLIPGYRVVHVDPIETLTAIAALRRQPDVLYAEPNYIMHALAVPNDPFFGEQYGLAKIGAQQVWDNFTTGSSEVVVAVVDQAIQLNHQDLAANIWTNPAPGSVVVNGTAITGDLHGYDFKHNTGDLTLSSEAETHATHVAGIIGAAGNNSTGVTGVNWNVKLMSLKFLDPTGDGDTGDLIDALSYAKQMRDLWIATNKAQGANVRVINASFGDPAFSTPLQTTVNSLNTSGILVVAGASNTDNGFLEPNNDLIPVFPASLDAPNVISVAATDQTDALASFSHFGPSSVDIAAPGVGILSTTPPCAHPGPFPDFPCEPKYPLNFTSTQDTYSLFDGTSMSTPHVSGAAALLWAQNPNLTVKQVKDLLMLNGDVVPALIDKTLTARRLNVFKSFQSLQENDVTAPGAVTNLHLNVQNGRTLNIGWTSSGDDGAGGGSAALYELSFVDSGTNAVTPLKGIVPTAPGTVQNTQVTIPFRHTNGSLRVRPFDNKGNQGVDATLPVVVSLLDGDPYIVTVEPNPAPLSTGGLLQDANGDDRYLDFLFPINFPFPFFGQTFRDGVIISSNGNLFFSPPPTRKPLKPGDIIVDDADDPPGSRRALAAHMMIAGLWEDLDLSHGLRGDAGVYFLQPSPSQMIFRWQGVPCNFDAAQDRCLGGDPVNFEIELRTDGTIKLRYGAGNTGITPTVGIGGGDRDGYAVDSHTSEETAINLTNAREVTFTPRPQFSASVLDSSQVEMKSWKNEGRTFVYAKLTFPDAGYTVTDWGVPVRVGNAFSVNATVQHFNGPTPQAISNTAQIWDLGALAAGDYTFTLKTSGTTAKTLNFTVSDTAPPPNPIDDAREFVRWQYKDFLRREPDGPGWDHWTEEITMCSDPANRRPGETEALCVDRKRENTSAAFFLSPEFSNTGYFVLRMYRGSLGRMPHFGGTGSPNDEFTRDAVTVGQGIVVNNALSPAVINANKQAFANEFVTRPEFRAIYDPLNNTQYVDKLFQTTGVTPTASDRQALIDGLNGGSETRGTVLFKVVDGTTTNEGGLLTFNTTYGKQFYDNLFNAAFVQMEYFGYLQRDPDSDGYAFWLAKLNLFGDWVKAQMVRAFITSPEYRSRFGQP